MNDQPHDPGKPDDQLVSGKLTPVPIDEQPALTTTPKRSRRWPWIVLLIAIAAAAGAGWYWFGPKSEEQVKARGKGDPNARTMPVVAAPARKGTIDVYVDALGTVVPRNMVVVRTRV